MWDWLIVFLPIAIPGVLFAGGWLIGSYIEKKHFKSIEARKAEFADIRLTNLKRITDPDTVAESTMIIGQVVIATDYFKSFVTAMRNLVGGEMKAAMSMMLRARDEATLRLQAEARRIGATEIWNLRYDTSNISQMSGNKGAMQVEIYVWGTAVTRRSS